MRFIIIKKLCELVFGFPFGCWYLQNLGDGLWMVFNSYIS